MTKISPPFRARLGDSQRLCMRALKAFFGQRNWTQVQTIEEAPRRHFSAADILLWGWCAPLWRCFWFWFQFSIFFCCLSVCLNFFWLFCKRLLTNAKVSRRSSTRAIWLIDFIVCRAPLTTPCSTHNLHGNAILPPRSTLYSHFFFFGVCFDQFEYIFFIVAIERRTQVNLWGKLDMWKGGGRRRYTWGKCRLFNWF